MTEIEIENKKAKLKEAKTNRYSLTIKDEERPHTLLKLEYSNYNDLIDTLATIGEDITLDELKELLKSFSSEEFYKVLDSLYQEKGETKDE